MAGGSTIQAVGALANAAVGLTEYVLGTNTSSSGKTSSSSSASTTVSENSSTDTDSTVTQQNTADPTIIAALKSLASTALSNSTDPTKTQGIITNFLQQANDAMTAVFGNQKQAGVYNSSAAAAQNNDILSRASADAAQAILGYQETEQTTADTALNQAGTLTSGQITTTDTSSKTSDTATTNVQSSSTGTSSSSSKSGLSVVCTWMFERCLITPRKYYIVSEDLWAKPLWQQFGYLWVGQRLVKILDTYPKSWRAKAIVSIFSARTDYVCTLHYPHHIGKKSIYGWIARALVACMCTPSSLYYLTLKRIWTLALKLQDRKYAPR